MLYCSISSYLVRFSLHALFEEINVLFWSQILNLFTVDSRKWDVPNKSSIVNPNL